MQITGQTSMQLPDQIQMQIDMLQQSASGFILGFLGHSYGSPVRCSCQCLPLVLGTRLPGGNKTTPPPAIQEGVGKQGVLQTSQIDKFHSKSHVDVANRQVRFRLPGRARTFRVLARTKGSFMQSPGIRLGQKRRPRNRNHPACHGRAGLNTG